MVGAQVRSHRENQPPHTVPSRTSPCSPLSLKGGLNEAERSTGRKGGPERGTYDVRHINARRIMRARQRMLSARVLSIYKEIYTRASTVTNPAGLAIGSSGGSNPMGLDHRLPWVGSLIGRTKRGLLLEGRLAIGGSRWSNPMCGRVLRVVLRAPSYGPCVPRTRLGTTGRTTGAVLRTACTSYYQEPLNRPNVARTLVEPHGQSPGIAQMWRVLS